MWYSDDLIVKRVSRQVRERTRENMEIYNMSLSDAFEEAARNYAKGLEHAANIIRKHIRDLWAAAVQPGAKWLESMSLQVRLL